MNSRYPDGATYLAGYQLLIGRANFPLRPVRLQNLSIAQHQSHSSPVAATIIIIIIIIGLVLGPSIWYAKQPGQTPVDTDKNGSWWRRRQPAGRDLIPRLWQAFKAIDFSLNLVAITIIIIFVVVVGCGAQQSNSYSNWNQAKSIITFLRSEISWYIFNLILWWRIDSS